MWRTVQVARLASNGQDTLQCQAGLAKVRRTPTSAISHIWTPRLAHPHIWTPRLVHPHQLPACLLISALATATMSQIAQVVWFASSFQAARSGHV